MFTEYLFLFFLGLITIYLLGQKRPKNYPPTPYSFPILGHIPLLGRETFKTLKEWKAKSGPVVGIDLGGVKCIAISDAKLIKEALSHPNFTGRGTFPFIKESRGGGNRGVVVSLGHTWEDQRRFTLRNLRDLGFGRAKMEEQIHEEITELIDYFRSQIGNPISIKNKFNVAVVNALWRILYSERFEHKDPQLAKIVALLTEAVQKDSMKDILLLHPSIANNFPKLAGMDRFLEEIIPIVDFIKEKLKDHHKNYIQGEPRDFVDIYTDEIKKTKDPNSSFYGEEGNLQLIYTVFDLFTAGSETTSTTLSWLLLFLLHYPDVQNKLRDEIKRVVGRSRLPNLSDKPNMPYCEAVIWETLRYSSLTPIGVFRSTLQDCEFNGYFIPKDTTIIPNLWSVHYDEEIWGDPHKFRPERFLSPDGKTLIRNENLMAFGYGKRVCLGESLARDELFLFSTAIYQNFKLTPDPSGPLPSLKPIVGMIILGPQDYKLVFNESNTE